MILYYVLLKYTYIEFSNVVPTLNFFDKSHLVIIYKHHVLLESRFHHFGRNFVFMFIRDVSVYISCKDFIWFCYQSHGGLLKWVWKCQLLFPKGVCRVLLFPVFYFMDFSSYCFYFPLSTHSCLFSLVYFLLGYEARSLDWIRLLMLIFFNIII